MSTIGLPSLSLICLPALPKLKYSLPSGPKMEGVDAVVVLRAVDAGEEHFLAVGLEVAVVVDQEEDLVERRRR